MMKVEFVRFSATDGVELQGWLSTVDSDKVVLHIHGMSGNGYSNKMIDAMRVEYAAKGVSMLTINTRGNGTITEMNKNGQTQFFGSCYEVFNDSEHDIQGAIDYLYSIGKTDVILQGHSLGCSKVVNYTATNPSSVTSIVLVAPTDMVRFAQSHKEHDEYYERAQSLIAIGKPREIVNQQCWLNKTPISAATYLSLSEPGSDVDIYGSDGSESALKKIEVPAVIIYGSDDIGIRVVDQTAEEYLQRVSNQLNDATEVSIVTDANHWFGHHIKELVQIASSFIA